MDTEYMKNRFKLAYMDVAERFSQESSATRLQVGAIIVKDDRIISIGYNGMPSGWDNNCEEKIYYNPETDRMNVHFVESNYPYEDDRGRYKLKTRDEVLHAESNALSKLARSNESGEEAVMFITHSPCLNCAKMIYQAGIKEVYYRNNYRTNDGVEFLKKCGIIIEQV